MNSDHDKLSRELRITAPEPPPGLLERLRNDIPETLEEDLPSRPESSYFTRNSHWLTAASVMMLFSFALIISLSILSPQSDRAVELDLSEPAAATKISESAAEATPIGAAARKRPPAEAIAETGESSSAIAKGQVSRNLIGNDLVTADSQRAWAPQTDAASAPASAPPVASEPRAAGPSPNRTDVSAAAQETASYDATERDIARPVSQLEAPDAIADLAPAESRAARRPISEFAPPPAAPDPAKTVGAAPSAYQSAPRTRARLPQRVALPASFTATFKVNSAGNVVSVRLDGLQKLPAAREELVRETLTQWQFDPSTEDERVIVLQVKRGELAPGDEPGS